MTCPVPLPPVTDVPSACTLVDVPFWSASMTTDPTTSTIYALDVITGKIWTCASPSMDCTQSAGQFSSNIGVTLN